MTGHHASEVMCAVFAAIHERICCAAQRAARAPEDVTLIAVSKFQSENLIRMAMRCGQRVFGENYVQEAMAKQASFLNDETLAPPEWHYVGHAQSNKAKDIAGRFALIHTVDNLRLAQGIARRLPPDVVQSVLVQVNVGAEAQKAGVSPTELPHLVEALLELSGIRVCGLMCLPPFFDKGELTRPYFAKLREARDNLVRLFGLPFPELSMGMSGDFEQAIEEGATFVRIGTALFGARSTR